MKHGVLTKIASQIGVTASATCRIFKGDRNASPEVADQLAKLFDTDIRLWLKGGDPATRRAAVEKTDFITRSP